MNEKMNLRERQKHKRSYEILAAAGAEFEIKGFEATRIEDIAARAEVAPATIYNYFGDKEGILVALFGERLNLQTERLVAAARMPFTDVLSAVDHFLEVTLSLEHASGTSDLFRQAYAASFGRDKGRLASFVIQDDKLVHDELIDLFTRLRKRGAVPVLVKPRDLADVVYAIGTYHWMRWVNGKVEALADVKREMKRQCRLAISGICGLSPGGRLS